MPPENSLHCKATQCNYFNTIYNRNDVYTVATDSTSAVYRPGQTRKKISDARLVDDMVN